MSNEQTSHSQKSREKEQRQLRPYRRIVALFLALGCFGLSCFLIIGIVRHLDRMASIEQFSQPDFVDHRALKACAEDLKTLDLAVRKQAAKLITTNDRDPHESLWQALERNRLKIIARCKLNQDGDDAAHASLRIAAENIESQIRSFHLWYAKHRRESAEYSAQTQQAVREALEYLQHNH